MDDDLPPAARSFIQECNKEGAEAKVRRVWQRAGTSDSKRQQTTTRTTHCLSSRENPSPRLFAPPTFPRFAPRMIPRSLLTATRSSQLLLQHPFLRGALNENPIDSPPSSSTTPQKVRRKSFSTASDNSVPLPNLNRGTSVATSGGSTPPINNRKVRSTAPKPRPFVAHPHPPSLLRSPQPTTISSPTCHPPTTGRVSRILRVSRLRHLPP